MKVCTDACLLGAWFAKYGPQEGHFLDIGSGTGLLMLLLAQKTKATIYGIELDHNSFMQAGENIQNSKWQEQLINVEGDVRSYPFPVSFDFIISNPPFFENDLASDEEAEKIAKHSKELNLEELLEVIHKNLTPKGSFGILLPFHRWEYFHSLATQHRFFLKEKITVKQTKYHPPFRVILHYSSQENMPKEERELIIKEGEKIYSPEFVTLLKDYYQKL